jgi:hypothetical protein
LHRSAAAKARPLKGLDSQLVLKGPSLPSIPFYLETPGIKEIPSITELPTEKAKLRMRTSMCFEFDRVGIRVSRKNRKGDGDLLE